MAATKSQPVRVIPIRVVEDGASGEAIPDARRQTDAGDPKAPGHGGRERPPPSVGRGVAIPDRGRSTEQPYPLSDTELRALQSVLLEMLIEVDRVCKKNGVNYSLFMGTLLGAVRHQGFIPWDDDLDVAMLRPEYDKFKEACRRDLDHSRFFLQDHLTDPHYRWGYARIRRKDSEFVRFRQDHMKMRTGIFLDVFPLDGVPDSPTWRALHATWCFTLRKILYSESGRISNRSRWKRLWYSAVSLIPHAWALRMVDQMARGRLAASHVRILTFPLPPRGDRGYRRSWLEDRQDLPFEGHAFPGPRDAAGLLTFSYGDYKRPPPPEERVCGHPASKFSLPSSARTEE